jgi:Zn-finger nucleic acid-binding protein
MMKCPRDDSELRLSDTHGVATEACPRCKGEWLDFNELQELESTVAHSDGELAGMIEYSKRASELKCPHCQKPMVAFDYRGNSLELDACPDEHGFWLDTDEAERVRQLMRERVSGLQRSSTAERKWNRDRESNFKGGVIDKMRNMFGGRR